MAKKRKYYVVWDGVEPGVYDNWQAAQAQIKGYPGAKYKSFKTEEEALEAYAEGYTPPESKARSQSKRKPAHLLDADIDWESWSVDAACSGNPGIMEYRGVHTKDRTEIFHLGPFAQGTNNVGEFLALVHALALLKKLGDASTTIYSDSKIAMGWVRKKHANTKLKRTSRNVELFDLIKRAEAWLRNNSYSNPIVKWNTEEWGEIPADFGRK